MFSRTARYYDLIYSEFKNYRAESAKVAELIRLYNPNYKTILDVACGTGEHARFLTEQHGFDVDCLDIEPSFVEIAASKLKASRVHLGDMTSFQLPNKYDVVLCLFSSIGYVRTLEGVHDALERFRDHLAPAGLMVVEPWFEPGGFVAGRFSVDVARAEDVVISRLSHTSVQGTLSQIQFEYLIGTASGIEHSSETHVLGLFTREQLMESFEDCGLAVEYDPVGLFDRGMYVARRA
jgi:SAM-dependent methyltransferase